MPTIPSVVRDAAKYPTIFMETGANAVAGGAADAYGWISGTPAGLAAAASGTALFDLGPDWAQYPVAQISVRHNGPSSGLSAIVASSRDDNNNATNSDRFLGPVAGTNGGVYSVATSSASSLMVRPMGRYLVVGFTNADAVNAVGAAAKVTVAAHAG